MRERERERGERERERERERGEREREREKRERERERENGSRLGSFDYCIFVGISRMDLKNRITFIPEREREREREEEREREKREREREREEREREKRERERETCSRHGSSVDYCIFVGISRMDLKNQITSILLHTTRERESEKRER